MPEASFTISAVVTDGDVFRHFRDRDHRGVLLDTSVELEDDIGDYPAGTTLAVVLADLTARLEALA